MYIVGKTLFCALYVRQNWMLTLIPIKARKFFGLFLCFVYFIPLKIRAYEIDNNSNLH